MLLKLVLLAALANQPASQPSFDTLSLQYHQNNYEWFRHDGSVTFENIQSGGYANKWLPVDSLKKASLGHYWLKVYFPTLQENQSYYLQYYYPYNRISYYTREGKAFVKRVNITEDKEAFVPGKYDIKVQADDLFEGGYLLVSISIINSPYNYPPFDLRTLNENAYSISSERVPLGGIIWIGIINTAFAGAILIVFFYVLVLYAYDHKKLYLYYLLYLITIGIYLSTRVPIFRDYITPLFRDSFETLEFHFGFTFQYLAHYTYLWFSILFLNSREDYPLHYKLGRYFGYLTLLSAAANILVIESSMDSMLIPYIFWIERPIAILFTIFAQVYVFIRRKNVLALFIVIGSICFLTGATLATFGFGIKYMQIGTLLEVLTFSLGLAYRINITEKEKRLYQNQLIAESKKREELQLKYNEQLQEEVKQRSEEIVEQKVAIEKQQKEVLKISLEREIDRVKMIALRTQMKPHFLFNAINSIRALIIKKDTDAAYESLLIFSKLIRYILESSEQDTVTLREEVNMMNVYVSLEKMRLADDFNYTCELAEGMDMDHIYLPPLILQPFIENAILHGLVNKEGPKQLTIQIAPESDYLKCVVVDNGVGRSTKKSPNGKKSMAIDLTTKRIELIDPNNTSKTIRIDDLKDEDGNALGTEVHIWLPLIRN